MSYLQFLKSPNLLGTHTEIFIGEIIWWLDWLHNHLGWESRKG